MTQNRPEINWEMWDRVTQEPEFGAKNKIFFEDLNRLFEKNMIS